MGAVSLGLNHVIRRVELLVPPLRPPGQGEGLKVESVTPGQ